MITLLISIAALVLTAQAFIGLAFLISCLWEKEYRASVFAGVQFSIMLSLMIAFLFLVQGGFFDGAVGVVVLVAGVILAAGASHALYRKNGANPGALAGTKDAIVGEVERWDEREIVFARNRTLRPGSREYELFYREHPELEERDAARRKLGGPMGIPGRLDGPHGDANVAAAMASVIVSIKLSDAKTVKPDPNFKSGKIELTPARATEKIKGFAENLGADLVGVTRINPAWVYSYKGEIFQDNWDDWGREIEPAHEYAVVFALEMDAEMVSAAPHSPTAIESMRVYARGAAISVQLATFIANLGYSAAANHFRHYEALLVPLAVDAGLGEIGRHGYLISKKFGPRIRLGAVTTDLVLAPDAPVDIGVEDFCRICKKCAACCPSRSIPSEGRTVVNGSRRWMLDAESCFTYWGKVGSDCNVCMRVCPWSHADTFPHRFVKQLITRNRIARRLFYHMDDLFYGRRPKAGPGPRWSSYKAGNR